MKSRHRTRSLAAALGLTLMASARLQAAWIETAQLAASGGAATDHFSWRVAIDGNTAVVVRPNLFGNSGYARVFVRSAGVWSEAAQLLPSFGFTGFGDAVAISGDTIVVGTEFGTNGSVAWVFVRPGGGWLGTLNESASLTNAGKPIAFAGSNIVAGPVVFVKPGGGWSGAIPAAAILAPSDSPAGFGASIGASGDFVVIGAPTTTVGGLTESGKAYVFQKPGGGWRGVVNESAQLFPSNPAAFSNFGWAAAMDGTTAVVTSLVTQGGSQEGEGYVFVEPGGGWAGNLTENARLDPSDATFLDSFGWSVGISGGNIAIGDPVSSGNSNVGAVYVFQRPGKGWSGVLLESQELVDTDPLFLFGWSLAISGNTIVAGEPSETVGGNSDQGQAHVFEFFPLLVARIRFLVEGPVFVAPGVPIEFPFSIDPVRDVPLPPTGEVIISDQAGHICRTTISVSGGSSCQITFGGTGRFLLRAHYLGNFAFRESTSPGLEVIVQAGGG